MLASPQGSAAGCWKGLPGEEKKSIYHKYCHSKALCPRKRREGKQSITEGFYLGSAL